MGKPGGRFGYLEKPAKKDKKSKKTRRQLPEKVALPRTDASRERGRADEEDVATIYVRRETIRAVWREVKSDGGENLSELVEDLLLAWLRERTRRTPG